MVKLSLTIISNGVKLYRFAFPYRVELFLNLLTTKSDLVFE